MRNTTKHTSWSPPTDAVVDGVSIEAGQKLVIENETGVFHFRHLGKDGSLCCWGGENQHESWRNFAPSRCHLPGWVPSSSAPEEKQSRASKYGAFEMWASANQGKTFTTAELVEVSGFSTATLLKYLPESLHFEKLKRGSWRIRHMEDSRD